MTDWIFRPLKPAKLGHLGDPGNFFEAAKRALDEGNWFPCRQPRQSALTLCFTAR